MKLTKEQKDALVQQKELILELFDEIEFLGREMHKMLKIKIDSKEQGSDYLWDYLYGNSNLKTLVKNLNRLNK